MDADIRNLSVFAPRGIVGGQPDVRHNRINAQRSRKVLQLISFS